MPLRLDVAYEFASHIIIRVVGVYNRTFAKFASDSISQHIMDDEI